MAYSESARMCCWIWSGIFCPLFINRRHSTTRVYTRPQASFARSTKPALLSLTLYMCEIHKKRLQEINRCTSTRVIIRRAISAATPKPGIVGPADRRAVRTMGAKGNCRGKRATSVSSACQFARFARK